MSTPGPSSRLYFATKGRLIKVGISDDAKARARTAGWELLTSLPGNLGRETAVLWALREHRAEGEWLFSRPPVWRLVLEAMDTGALSWLPPEPPRHGIHPKDLFAEVSAFFGGDEAAADRLGYSRHSICNFRSPSNCTPLGLWGRYQAERARQAGLLSGPPVILSEAA